MSGASVLVRNPVMVGDAGIEPSDPSRVKGVPKI